MNKFIRKIVYERLFIFSEGAHDLLEEVLRTAEPESEVEPEGYAEPKGFDDEAVDEGTFTTVGLFF